MQAVRNGLKSVARTPWKTVLFVLILAVLSALLSIALCVRTSVSGYLKDCDDFYRSIVELEFVGPEYPSLNLYDLSAEAEVEAHRSELEALVHENGVISFEPADSAVMLFEGYERKDRRTYDAKAAVLLIKMEMQLQDGTYAALIERSLYAQDNVSRKYMIMNDVAKGVEKNKKYLVAGHFYQGKNSYFWFSAEDFEIETDEGTTVFPAFTEYSEEAEERYAVLADRVAARNCSCRVWRTANTDDIAPFNQQEIQLKEGRLFTEEEYRESADVIVISDISAGIMGVGPGDKVRAALIETDGNVYSRLGFPDSYKEYEVVGVYEFNDRYPQTVFLPDSGASERPLRYTTGYLIGTFHMKNGTAEALVEKAQGLTEYGFRFSVFDQGYSAATGPMEELSLISIAFLVICLIFVAAALALYGHLFVSRQRDTAATMLALGSGRPHVFGYFVTAALAAAVPAAIIGCIAGKLLESRVFNMLVDFAKKLAEQDLRYSSSRITVTKTLSFDPKVSPFVYVLAGLIAAAASALVTFLFASGAVKERKNKKKKEKKQVKPRSVRSSKLSGLLKYSVLSARRNLVRTFAVILLCVIVAVFFGQLTSSLDANREQLAAIRRDSVIKGHATDVTGHMIDGLAVAYTPVQDVMDSTVVKNANPTIKHGNLMFTGIQIDSEGNFIELPPFEFPDSEFALETLENKLIQEPKWELTLNLGNSSAFYYTTPQEVVWLEGYSEADFESDTPSDELSDALLCALPKSYMEKNGIKLGDTVRFVSLTTVGYYDYGYDSNPGSVRFDIVPGKVIAYYVPVTDTDVIFTPLRRLQSGKGRSFSSFTFELTDTSRLDELRQLLEDSDFKYVAPGERSNSIAVIDDEIFLNVTKSMERQIQYVGALYVSLYALAGAVGAVLAWLMISSRRKEIANLRALGTQRTRVILNFVFEQTLLSAVGLFIGAAAQYLAGRTPNRLQIVLTCAFFFVWVVSTLVSMIVNLSKKTMDSLTEPE